MSDSNEPTAEVIAAQQLAHLDSNDSKGDPTAAEIFEVPNV